MPPVKSRDRHHPAPARRPRSTAGRPVVEEPASSPNRRYDVIAVGLIALGFLILAALARPWTAGAFGEWLVDTLRYVFGVGAWFSPLLLWALGLGYALDRRRRPPHIRL